MKSSDVCKVLFLCTGNSARSQIAEALLRSAGGNQFEVASAGTEPKGIHHNTFRVLAEIGIDWGAATSDHISKYSGQAWDHVITVCDRAKTNCPVIPTVGKLVHWSLEDPVQNDDEGASSLPAFKRTVDALFDLIAQFVADHKEGRCDHLKGQL